ncbi:SsrA-binding protein SmpB [Magnetovibrio sp. PR-2]|uniref:SsrA-binding protein SmpB n=1 Tax=Magnetovibrio sp. PR-2 TaxID=3120356 RepID=UPI002FCE2A64
MAKKKKKKGPDGTIVAQNRKARHDYFIEDTVEAGIQLMGSEVKSLRKGSGSIGESYAVDKSGEMYLTNAYIPEYAPAAKYNGHEPRRERKLLLHKREIYRLMGNIQREGYTVVPLSIYFNTRGIAKVELGLAKGKHKSDKRQSSKDRDWKRDKARLLSHKNQ